MAFESHDDDEVMGEINMTPLVDVMLVLLVVFMLTVPVLQHAVTVDLPRASSVRAATPADTLQLSIDAQGHYFLGTQALDAAGLREALQRAAAREPQPHLHIRGDRQVAYDHVAEAMTAAQRAGLQHIGFITQPSTP